MAAGLYGADVAQLRSLAAQFSQAADQLDRGRLQVGDGIRISAWIGPFAASFRLRWDSEHSLRIAAAAHRLRDGAARLRANADEQERASAADGGSGRALAQIVPPSMPASDASPSEVRDWWNSLTSEQQQALIKQDPVRIGNLNGVPFEARAEANRLTAQSRLDAVQDRLREMGDEPPEVSPWLLLTPVQHAAATAARDLWLEERKALLNEQGFLTAVTEGRRTLVVYDPAEERIVEMLGKPGPGTTDVITYVPGTGTNMDSFHSGGAQQVATYLTDTDKSGGTVSFVYKDGPWSSWSAPWSETANTSNAFAMREGRQLAEFQQAVALETELAGARTTAMGHSAGMSILSGSEAAGAHYDNAFSLAGAWLVEGWQPDPATNYQHFQYGVDALNYAQPFGDYPAETPAFGQNVMAPGVHHFVGIPYQNELGNHTRIGEGPKTNQDALLRIAGEIYR